VVGVELRRPFVVLATQNPSASQDGTYRLPAAQLDRFLARISLGYPTTAMEVALLRGAGSHACGGVRRTSDSSTRRRGRS
jgi:MoxR-like ATPase